LRFSWGQWSLALLSVVFMIVAWFAYKAATGKARSWVDVVTVAYDLYRDKLRTQLGMRQSKGRLLEKADWDALSRWILFRQIPTDDLLTDWSVPPPVPEASAFASSNVT